MKVKLIIGTDLGRTTEIVEATGVFAAVQALCLDPRLAQDLLGRPHANVVILASPYEPLPGMTPAGRRTQEMLAQGAPPQEVARAFQS